MEQDVFRAIADATRREILVALREKPMPVHEIANRFSVSRPAISRHLRVLGDARLVRPRRIAKENVYTINVDALGEIEAWLKGFWNERLQLLKRLAEGDA